MDDQLTRRGAVSQAEGGREEGCYKGTYPATYLPAPSRAEGYPRSYFWAYFRPVAKTYFLAICGVFSYFPGFPLL